MIIDVQDDRRPILILILAACFLFKGKCYMLTLEINEIRFVYICFVSVFDSVSYSSTAIMRGA